MVEDLVKGKSLQAVQCATVGQRTQSAASVLHLVPTLCVGTHSATLLRRGSQDTGTQERPALRSHAERGNESRFWLVFVLMAGLLILAHGCHAGDADHELFAPSSSAGVSAGSN
jgi:hypothetical protein